MTELVEYLTPERVVLLTATTKAEVLEEMIDVMVASDGDIPRGGLSQEVWKREKLMSTGIGHGLAIPHVRMEAITKATMVVGISREGITDYESLDKKPVHIVVLIAAPAGQHEVYIRLLAKIADVLKEEPLRQAILEAADPAVIHRILIEGKP